jgi:hypothetical protein
LNIMKNVEFWLMMLVVLNCCKFVILKACRIDHGEFWKAFTQIQAWFKAGGRPQSPSEDVSAMGVSYVHG